MNFFLSIILISTVFCFGKKISDQCTFNNKWEIECSCIGKEEFVLPENFDYSNVTRLVVTSCARARIKFWILGKSQRMEDIIVQNISENLAMEPFLKIPKLRLFQLLRIKKITLVKHDTFSSISKLERFSIEDIWIENFEEQFTSTNVRFLTMKNVTIDRMIGINLSERGASLVINDCLIKNVQTTLNFAFFEKIDIRNSEFQLEKPGHLSIEGISAFVLKSVFTNVSMNLVASNDITIESSCADGKSSLRLSANKIQSFGNKLPTEIVYTKNSALRDNDNDFPLIVNNTVCIAGNCKCPKSAGHNSYERFHANVYLGILLIVHLPGLF